MPAIPGLRWGRQDSRLMCKVKRLNYDFCTREGEIHFPAGHCCDMGGCIELFKVIDPDVREIRTYAGDKADTVYRFNVGDSGEWSASNW